jgi:PAS domain S-box-containing protein
MQRDVLVSYSEFEVFGLRTNRLRTRIILYLLIGPYIGVATNAGSILHAQPVIAGTSSASSITATALAIAAVVSFCLGALTIFACGKLRSRPLRQTKKNPSQQESFLQVILKSTHDGYIGIKTKGRIVEVNDAYCRMSGYTKEELLGMRIQDLEAIDSKEEIAARLERISKEGGLCFESSHRKKNGELFQVELSVTSVKESPIAMIGLCRDISERRLIQSALSYSSDLMRYVIEHTRSAIAIHDTDLRYLYVSKRYLTDYHVTDTDIIGKHHYDVFPDLPQKWRDVHQRCLKGEVISADDDQYERSDGSIAWTRWECRPWFQQNGEIGGIIVFTEVINERKEIEFELLQTKDHLEKLIGHANAPIVVWDAQQRITRFNHAFELITGKKAEEVLDTSFELLFPPDRRQAIVELMDAINLQQNPDSIEIDILHKDGSVRTVLWNSARIFDQNNHELIATIAQGQDITGRKIAEKQVSAQLKELQRWYQVMLNREDRIVELKKEVNDLLSLLAQSPRYPSTTLEDPV